MIKRKRFGLALSGGGYRAAAFHLGTLHALHRMGLLDKLDVISSVSGGSILSAFYALHRKDYEWFEREMIVRLQRGVLRTSVVELICVCLLLLIGCIWMGLWLLFPFGIYLFFFHYQLFPWSKFIQKEYDRVFFRKATLGDLPETPQFVINTTDMASGRPFVFSRKYMGGSDYANIDFKTRNFPLSQAVMASSCVPFAFGPVRIERKYYENKKQYCYNTPLLIDGGIYDNQGSQKLSEDNSWFRADYILVSDAGNGKIDTRNTYNVLLTLIKTSNLLMARIKRAQIRENIYDKLHSTRRYAYVELGWETSERLLYGFVDNILEGNIDEELIRYHHLSEVYIKAIKDEDDEQVIVDFKKKLVDELKKSINWPSLARRIPTDNMHQTALKVGTNLTGLSINKIYSLLTVADWMTEVQMKLYLPYVFPNY
jgi:NTE family protein